MHVNIYVYTHNDLYAHIIIHLSHIYKLINVQIYRYILVNIRRSTYKDLYLHISIYFMYVILWVYIRNHIEIYYPTMNKVTSLL